MHRIRLLAAAVVALTLLTATPAQAATSVAPTVDWVTSDFEGNVGTLQVRLSAPEGVAALRADVRSNVGEVLAGTDRFTLVEGDEQSGLWATDEPFRLAELGAYQVDVTVTDRTGTTVTRADAGYLTYVVQTSFESLAVEPATATYDKREVTVSGALLGKWPGSGEVRPVAGASIEISAYMETVYATTGADGSFAGAVPITDDGMRVRVAFGWDPNLLYHSPANANVANVAIKPRATRVSAVASDRRVEAGKPVSLSGFASWRTRAGWEPVSSGQVAVSQCDEYSCSPPYEVVPVGADGGYSVTVTPSYTQTLQVAYIPPARYDGRDDPYVAGSTNNVRVVVLQASEIAAFTASRGTGGLVEVRGRVHFPGNSTPADIPVMVQYSTTGTSRGGWVTVGEPLQARWNGEGHAFEADLTEARSGWWRVRFPGVTDQFAPAVSATVKVD